MSLQEKQITNLPDLALEAMEDVIIADDIANIRESLTQFFYEWIQSEDDHDIYERRNRLFHYQVILGILSSAEAIKKARNESMNN